MIDELRPGRKYRIFALYPDGSTAAVFPVRLAPFRIVPIVARTNPMGTNLCWRTSHLARCTLTVTRTDDTTRSFDLAGVPQKVHQVLLPRKPALIREVKVAARLETGETVLADLGDGRPAADIPAFDPDGFTTRAGFDARPLPVRSPKNIRGLSLPVLSKKRRSKVKAQMAAVLKRAVDTSGFRARATKAADFAEILLESSLLETRVRAALYDRLTRLAMIGQCARNQGVDPKLHSAAWLGRFAPRATSGLIEPRVAVLPLKPPGFFQAKKPWVSRPSRHACLIPLTNAGRVRRAALGLDVQGLPLGMVVEASVNAGRPIFFYTPPGDRKFTGVIYAGFHASRLREGDNAIALTFRHLSGVRGKRTITVFRILLLTELGE